MDQFDIQQMMDAVTSRIQDRVDKIAAVDPESKYMLPEFYPLGPIRIHGQATDEQKTYIAELSMQRGLDMAGVDDLGYHQARQRIKDLKNYKPDAVGPPVEYSIGTADAAKRLGLSVQKVRRVAQGGQLKSIMYRGHRRYARRDLDEYMSVEGQ